MEKTVGTLAVILIVLAYAMPMFYIPDPLFVVGLLMASLLAFQWWKNPFRLTFADWSLIAVGVYSAFGPTVNVIGNMVSSTLFCGSVMMYFLVRMVFRLHPDSIKSLFTVLSVCISLLLFAALYQFGIFEGEVFDAGFTSLYDFRFLYNPLGILSNEWNALMWLWGGILAATYIKCENKKVKLLSVVAGCVVLIMMLLSFSRGGYIALAICVLAVVFVFYRHPKKRQLVWCAGTLFVLAACVAVFYGDDMMRTVKMNETVSQQRSTDSRVNGLKLTKDIVTDYPFGVGAGNYTLAKDYYQRGDIRSDNYSSFAPNIVSQVIVEGGIVGLLLYCMLISAICYSIWRLKNNRMRVVGIFLLGFFIKELSFPTMFNSSVVQQSLLLLLAVLQQSDKDKVYANSFVAVLPVAMWIGMFCSGALYLNPKSDIVNVKASELDVCNVAKSALKNEDKAAVGRLAAEYPDKMVYRWTLYSWYKNEGKNEKACGEFVKLVLRHPRVLETNYWKKLVLLDFDFAECVRKSLATEIKKKPTDYIELARYGSVALQIGETKIAERYLGKVAQSMPNLSRVWANMAVIKEQKGDEAGSHSCLKRYWLIENGIFASNTPDYPVRQSNIEEMIEADCKQLSMTWYRRILK